MDQLIRIFEEMERAIGPVGAIFCVAAIALYLDNRAINKDLRESIPKRVETDVLIHTTLARVASTVEMMANKR